MRFHTGSTLIAATLLAFATAFPVAAQTYDVIHNFTGTDGDEARGTLREVGSDFYGTTTLGGAAGSGCPAGCGTAFRMDASGNLTTIHSFVVASEGVDARAGLCLGTDGDFYATTLLGGADGSGTIYRMTAGGTVTPIHEFDRDTGPWFPTAALIQADDGDFYGTTLYGKCPDMTDACAVLYRVTAGGSFTVLHTFHQDEGTNPEGPVLQASDGNLYGTTSSGGGGNPSVCGTGCGTIFRRVNGTVTPLHVFIGDDGSFPMGRLTQASDGNIYGTTAFGGASNHGTIFRIDTSGTLVTRHSFDGTDGGLPQSGILEANDGNFYGTTEQGGAFGFGTIFRMDSNGVVVTLHDFDATGAPTPGHPDGLPEAAAEMTQASDGRIYGVRARGGDFGFVFRLTLPLPPRYCPDSFVRRDQMAAFLLKTEHGAAFAPPACSGFYADVSCPGLFSDWIEQLHAENITSGCGGGDYCPLSPITRGQMAVFLLKTEHGPSHTPPACTGIFLDVPCGSPFADWIEELASETITGGCGGDNFCPANPVTRAQMAVFLLKMEHGGSHVPPTCTPTFADVPCPSLFAAWIEELFHEGITAGCSGS